MNCWMCEKELESSYYSHYFPDVREVKYLCEDCWRIAYWESVLADPNTLIYDGRAYFITDIPKNGGFGKAGFNIQMNDGRYLEGVGLWLNGEIPEDMKKEDNGAIISRY